MIEYCQGCKRKHESFGWKYKQGAWYCTKHYKIQSPEFYNQKQGDKIRKDRLKHSKDTVQPFRSGEPSREFARLYPEKAKKTFTAKECRNCKDVWRDIKGLRDVQETK